ncbi:MAG: NAD(P)/FAD-dependent oxidoreductase [Pseudomonadota bacterium]
MRLKRRQFVGAGVAALTLSSRLLRGQTRPRIVVVGGGAGGATAALALSRESTDSVDVVLVEPTRTYHSCFYSNLYLGGFRQHDSLAHSYTRLASQYGVNVVHDWVVGIEREAREVRLASGGTIAYDRLVLSPGIDFVPGSVPGWDLSAQSKMPHAYKGGTQLALLRSQVLAMKPGGVFALIAPPNPYRCPPGPYERVSMLARTLQATNPSAKLLIVDPKTRFAKQALFEESWARHYPGMIERIDADAGGAKVEVRPERMELVIDGSVQAVDVCNVIPAQQAGRICSAAGLTVATGWAPVVPASMRSRADENIYILGDASQQGDMPKSAFSANSQAKVAVRAILASLTDSPLPRASYANTCWSLVAEDDSVKIGATYTATPEKITKVSGFVSDTGEPEATRRANYLESVGWYAGITAEMFGGP